MIGHRPIAVSYQIQPADWNKPIWPLGTLLAEFDNIGFDLRRCWVPDLTKSAASYTKPFFAQMISLIDSCYNVNSLHIHHVINIPVSDVNGIYAV